MSNKRKVRMFFTQMGKFETIETDAKTFGQLSSELNGTFDGKKVTVRDTSCELTKSSDELPEDQFTLFIYPRKSKAGKDGIY